MDVTVVVEGGLLRAVYVDGKPIGNETVYDFDVLEGGDEEELRDLLERIDAEPEGTMLRADLLTWRDDVVRALGYFDAEAGREVMASE